MYIKNIRQTRIVFMVCFVFLCSVLLTGCTEDADENDTDGDGVNDSEDAFFLDPAASMDSDGDGYPDAWNEGKTKNDTTTGLELDQFPEYDKFHSMETMFDWVDISPGTFIMGSSTGKSALQPPHQVNITKSFQILRFEVTQAQWTAIMGDNPSCFPGDDNPVELVSWKKCQSFVALLNENDSTHTYRLPTEAEWEYCCRAGTNTSYSFGNDSDELGDHAWYAKNTYKTTQPVGQKVPNPWGLYDMHGNVFEWCQDWYDEEYYKNSPENDPQGPVFQKSKNSIRGGSWDQHPVSLTSFWRQGHLNGAGNYIGVRIVRSSN